MITGAVLDYGNFNLTPISRAVESQKIFPES